LTWLTGKALPGQAPFIVLGSWSHVALNSLVLAWGVALSALPVYRGGFAWALRIGVNTWRLSYSTITPETADEAARRLAVALNRG